MMVSFLVEAKFTHKEDKWQRADREYAGRPAPEPTWRMMSEKKFSTREAAEAFAHEFSEAHNHSNVLVAFKHRKILDIRIIESEAPPSFHYVAGGGRAGLKPLFKRGKARR